jgi:hypothetical protein
MEKQALPRIYCIAATEAPVVAVFRRGPSNWAHVERWDLAAARNLPHDVQLDQIRSPRLPDASPG